LDAGLLYHFQARLSVGGGRPIEEAHRIHGGSALAHLEMDLRARYRPGLAGLRDDVAALHRVAALHEQILVMAVAGAPAAFMADEDEIAVTLELIAGIGDDAGFRRADIGSFRNGDIDAFIAQAARLPDIARNYPALPRPAEGETAGFLGRLRRIDHLLLRLLHGLRLGR